MALGFSADPAGVGPSGRPRFRHLRSLCLPRFTDDRNFGLVLFHQPAVTWRSVTVVIITTLSLQDKVFSVDWRLWDYYVNEMKYAFVRPNHAYKTVHCVLKLTDHSVLSAAPTYLCCCVLSRLYQMWDF